MSIIHARRHDTSVLVGNNRTVLDDLALDIATGLKELGDLVATSMVDEDFAIAHLIAGCL